MISIRELFIRKDKPVGIVCRVVEVQGFRSNSLINMTDDRKRVTLDMSKRDWIKLKKILTIRSNA